MRNCSSRRLTVPLASREGQDVKGTNASGERGKERRGTTMIHRIDATVAFVRDLAKCTTFYRDTLGLPVANSDANSVASGWKTSTCSCWRSQPPQT